MGEEVLVESNVPLLYSMGVSIGNSIGTVVNGLLDVVLTNFAENSVKVTRFTEIGTLFSATGASVFTIGVDPPHKDLEKQVHFEESRTKSLEEQITEMKFNKSLTSEQKQRITDLFRKHREVFPSKNRKLGDCAGVEHEIDTGDAKPVKRAPYRTSYAERTIIQHQVDEMVKDGIVQPSVSPWSFPVVLVKKKDPTEKPRFCVDFRALNKLNSRPMWPLPRVEDAVSAFGKSTVFTSLDFNSGFWQIQLAEKDRQKCSFVTMDGQYEFVRMPFGLAGATATFQKAIDTILSHLKWKGVVCYIDDVLIGGETFDQHLGLLDQVLAAVSKAGFTISPKKCEIALSQIKFLGYIISSNGIKPDPSKVEAIQNFKPPKNQKEIKSFIGALSYYRQFIEDFSTVAEPLLRLTRKTVEFEWKEEQTVAFGSS